MEPKKQKLTLSILYQLYFKMRQKCILKFTMVNADI